MTKSIEELAVEWGITEELAQKWVDKFADVPEGYVRLSPSNEPEMPYEAMFIGKSVSREDNESPMTVGKSYLVEPSDDDFMAIIYGITRQTTDDDGDHSALPMGAMGQFAIKVGGDE